MKKFLQWFLFGIVFLVAVVIVLFAINYLLPSGWKLNAVIILALASAALSLMFSYAKDIRIQFAALPDSYKALINILAVVLVAALLYIFVCAQLIVVPGLECGSQGLKTLLTYVAIAIVMNQTTDYISVDAPDVKQLKAGSSPSSEDK